MAKKVEKFDLISNSYPANVLIDNIKNNQRHYSNLLKVLNTLGTFTGETEAFLSEKIEKKDYKCIKLWCFDSSDNIFVFSVESTDKRDLYLIEKHEENIITKYDISFAKKFDITLENIDLLKTDKESQSKFGRIITDEKSFCTIFLKDDVSFQVKIFNNDLKLIKIEELQRKLNLLNDVPRLKDFIDIINDTIKNIESLDICFLAYKDFKKIGEVNLMRNCIKTTPNQKCKTKN